MNNLNVPQPQKDNVVDYAELLRKEKMDLDTLFEYALNTARQNSFSDSRMENLVKEQDTGIEATVRLAHRVLRNILLSHGAKPKKFLFFESNEYKKDYTSLLNLTIELMQAIEFDPETIVNERAIAVRNLANSMNQKYHAEDNILDTLDDYIVDTIKNAVKVQKITGRYRNFDEDMQKLIKMRNYVNEVIVDGYSKKAVENCKAVVTLIRKYREDFEQNILATIHLNKSIDILVGNWSKLRKIGGRRVKLELEKKFDDTLSKATEFNDVRQQVESFFEGVKEVEKELIEDRNKLSDAYNQKLSEFRNLKSRFWELDDSRNRGEITNDDYNLLMAEITMEAERLSAEITEAEEEMKIGIFNFQKTDEIFKKMRKIMASEETLARRYYLAILVSTYGEINGINYGRLLIALRGGNFNTTVTPEVVAKVLNEYLAKQMQRTENMVRIGESVADVSKEIEEERKRKVQEYDRQKAKIYKNPIKNAGANVADLKNFFGPRDKDVSREEWKVEDILRDGKPGNVNIQGNPNPAEEDN